MEYAKLREKQEAKEQEEMAQRREKMDNMWDHHQRCTRAAYGGKSPKWLYDESFFLNMDKHGAGTPRSTSSL
jgi:hypothetical protein